MKLALLAGALALGVLSVAPADAQPSSSADNNMQAQNKAPNLTEFDKRTAQIQESIQKMQEQMDRIRQTQDPQERQKLLQEHWTTMQNSMGMMQGMWGQGMMGCCGSGPANGRGHMGGPGMMGWHGMRDYYSGQTPDQMKQRQYMMDQYMGMQQQMMNHMMMHQNYLWRQPSK